jgi:hypothetical protein
MFFRPSFCANCGERIQRVDWGPTVSRRFCQVCESEFKGQDLIPRFVVGISILIGIVGIGSSLKTGALPSEHRTVQASSMVDRRGKSQGTPVPQVAVANDSPVNLSKVEPQTSKQFVAPSQPPATSPPQPQAVASDPVYFCGAQTKKGSPCSRRVKGKVRCFQHIGMPAMLADDKLKIK